MAIEKAAIDYSLYLVTDRDILQGRDFLACMEAALAGGVSLLQLREKNVSSRDFFTLAMGLKELCQIYRVPLIINDRLDIMLAVDADGLHIGQEDMPLEIARRIIGPDKLLGYSVSSVKEALHGSALADYLGVGTVYPTQSKSDIGEPIGAEGLRAIKTSVAVPVIAIGGISQDNLQEVKAAGADGIAVISAVLGQANIQASSQELLRSWKRG